MDKVLGELIALSVVMRKARGKVNQELRRALRGITALSLPDGDSLCITNNNVNLRSGTTKCVRPA
jgi:hypothetical protein